MVGVAQLVEHLVVVQDVAGSSPVTHPRGRTRRIGERIRRGGSMSYYASLARVRRSHPRKRGLHRVAARQLDSGSR